MWNLRLGVHTGHRGAMGGAAIGATCYKSGVVVRGPPPALVLPNHPATTQYQLGARGGRGVGSPIYIHSILCPMTARIKEGKVIQLHGLTMPA